MSEEEQSIINKQIMDFYFEDLRYRVHPDSFSFSEKEELEDLKNSIKESIERDPYQFLQVLIQDNYISLEKFWY